MGKETGNEGGEGRIDVRQELYWELRGERNDDHHKPLPIRPPHPIDFPLSGNLQCISLQFSFSCTFHSFYFPVWTRKVDVRLRETSSELMRELFIWSEVDAAASVHLIFSLPSIYRTLYSRYDFVIYCLPSFSLLIHIPLHFIDSTNRQQTSEVPVMMSCVTLPSRTDCMQSSSNKGCKTDSDNTSLSPPISPTKTSSSRSMSTFSFPSSMLFSGT